MSDFRALPDLAARSLGGGVIGVNDEFFAPADNLVDPAQPTFAPRTFGAKGQLYDGWETRRRREPGYDWAIVRLGVPGIVRGVVVDTAFFTGNYPPAAAVEGCGVEGYPTAEELAGAPWQPLVPLSPLAGDARNLFAVESPERITHVRLSIHPDGGVARLRVHGEALPDPRLLAAGPVDLAALEAGGTVVGCSDMFYGSPGNLILPGMARTMGEGWETARRRGEGNDWVLIRLAGPGRIRLAELDTSHFKGNAPGAAALRGAGDSTDLENPATWLDLLPRTELRPDTRHRFLVPSGPVVTHVRLDVYPDGGMARLRLFGQLQDLDALVLRWFNALPLAQAVDVASACDVDRPCADRLARSRPLTEVPAVLRVPS